MSSTEKGVVSDIARGADWLNDGNNNFSRLRRFSNAQWGNDLSTTTALTYGYFGGTAWNGSAWTTVADGTVALTDNATNYVERTVAGVVSKNTSGFTASSLPMAKVVTSGGAITTHTDLRMETVPAGASFTTEDAQDAVGAMVDSSLVYVDGTPLLTRAALTGDVTASQGSNATTIANSAVTLAKMANLADSRLIGNASGGSAAPSAISVGSGLTLSSGVLDTAASGAVPDWARYDPLTPPAGYNSTVSDTFPGAIGASLDAKWTKTGAITLTTQINGGLLITGGTSATTQVGLIEQTAPSTPYTITAPVQLSTQGPTMAAGVYVRESSGGKFWTAEIFRNSSSRSDTYGQTARYASTSSRTSISGQTAIGWPFWIWVQLINDGTNLTCKFSIDGRVFEQFFTETIAASNLNGTTIDRIGIKWDNLSATAGKGTFRQFIVT